MPKILQCQALPQFGGRVRRGKAQTRMWTQYYS